ncbi:hypothetical protein C1I98_37390 [Spongiactinospora gelatinilytica]|uniref:Chaplin domain-containing protein n=1 Tax=Spongiactinospora gelatinilytica TaxID=2666298 RepID=A0A2W2F6P8_9ACTN|nr:chaplin family protein [Spongiactinospora gelatinilytica]PZG20778.1 hypothetical protein C1I98_37390 [Spongiactinospora gelatinilytica]
MRTWAKGTAPAALLAVAVMTVGSGTAAADTGGNGSVGGGNQVNAPVNLPIDISGNAVGVLGESSAGSQGGATVVNGGSGTGGNRTSGDGSVLGGNQIDAPINAPINACGNAIAVLGEADANCKGGATVVNRGHGAGGNHTSGDGSVLGGNQVVAPVTAPLNVCGNALAIFGNATAGCTGGSTVKNSGAGGGAGGNRTSGGGSVLGGNQVVAPISAPTDICGNAVAVLGGAFGSCKGGATVINGGSHGRNHHHHHRNGPHGSAGNDTDGRFGVGSGNQLIAPIDLPVEVCGNAVGGDASANCKGGATVVKRGRGAGGNRTSGQGGVLAGNQAVAPITAPINVCGNAAAVLGKAAAQCKGGAHVWPGRGGVGGGGNSTSGDGSVLGGNQVVAPITAPANICGNAVAVLGDAAAGCLGGSKVGGPGHPGDHYGRQHVRGLAPVDAEGVGGGGTAGGDLLSTLPAAPALTKTPVVSDVTGGTALPGVRDVTSLTGQTEGLGLPPAVGDMTKTEGLGLPPAAGDATKALGAPEPGDLTGQATRTLGVPDAGSALSTLPQLPGLPVLAETPISKPPAGRGTAEPAPAGKGGKAGKSSRSGKAGKATKKMSSRPVPGGRGDDKRRPKGGALSVAEPVTDLVGSTPAGGAVRDTAEGLPVKGLRANGLMSAEQPLGVIGMNSGALAALMLGAMFAVSATLLAGIRRLRFGRRP